MTSSRENSRGAEAMAPFRCQNQMCLKSRDISQIKKNIIACAHSQKSSKSSSTVTGCIGKMREAVKTANVHVCRASPASRPGLMTGSQDGCATLRLAHAEPLQGEARNFARVFQVKFVFDVRPMGFHCLGAEM